MIEKFILEIPNKDLLRVGERDKMILDAIRKANEIGFKGFKIKEITTNDDYLSPYSKMLIFKSERISLFERIAMFLNKIFGARA